MRGNTVHVHVERFDLWNIIIVHDCTCTCRTHNRSIKCSLCCKCVCVWGGGLVYNESKRDVGFTIIIVFSVALTVFSEAFCSVLTGGAASVVVLGAGGVEQYFSLTRAAGWSSLSASSASLTVPHVTSSSDACSHT